MGFKTLPATFSMMLFHISFTWRIVPVCKNAKKWCRFVEIEIITLLLVQVFDPIKGFDLYLVSPNGNK